jgi:GDPmannose 4,6-dehydratase
MKPVLVIGCEGQDGRLLCERLSAEGREVMGIDQGIVRPPRGVEIPPTDIMDASAVEAAVKLLQPSEIYYLAAYHHSSQDLPAGGDLEVMERSYAVHVRGLLHFLEAIRKVSPRSRLFYAASSLVFGDPRTSPQNEETPLEPLCAYGITKTAGVHCCRMYRSRWGVFASAGMLYTHESPRRGGAFVAQKIVRGAVAIKKGIQDRLVLGDLSARVDWGYAPDYVDAMTRILRVDRPGDYVVASGQAHTVKEFVETCFALLDLDWRRHVDEDASLLARRRQKLEGDATRLRRDTGWRPSVDFAELVRVLVRAAQEVQ